MSGIEDNVAYSGYTIFTDGHSLGGGMAQTFALENDLSGYGQNSLPISPAAIRQDGIITAAQLKSWAASNYTFNETNLDGDPATLYYSTLGRAFYPGGFYLSTTTTSVPNPYVIGELAGLGLSVVVPFLGVVLTAYSAYKSHSINTVVGQLQDGTTSADSSMSVADVNTEKATVETDSENNDYDDGLNSDGSVTVTDEDGNQYNIYQDFDGQGDVTSYIATYVPGGIGTLQEKYHQANDGSWELTLFHPKSFDDTISDFQPGNVIDLASAGNSTNAAFNKDQVINVQTDRSGAVALQLDSSFDLSNESFFIDSDDDGGSQITAVSDDDTLQFTANNQILVVVNPGNFHSQIDDLSEGDIIDLSAIGTADKAVLGMNNVLAVEGVAGGTFFMQLDPDQDFSDQDFTVSADGAGGTEVEAQEAAPVSGSITAVFVKPSPASAVVTGVGTADFGTGAGAPSTLAFSGASFDVAQNTPFKIGTISYHNGANTSAADSVELDITIDVDGDDSPATLDIPIAIVNTPNTDDPVASADTVSFGQSGLSFHVEEGDTASADLYATIADPPSPTLYVLTLVALRNPSAGGFVTTLTVNGVQSNQTVSAGTTITPFAGVAIADSFSALNQTLTVALSAAADGKLSNLGGGSYNAATGVYAVSGSAATVDAALDGLVFTPAAQVAAGQSVTTTFTITDTDTDGATVNDSSAKVTVTAPILQSLSISGTVAGQATSDQGTITPFGGVTIADSVAGLAETLTVTLSTAANGTLSDLSGGRYNTATGVYTIGGSAAAINSALNGLVFTPTVGEVAAGQTVTTGFTIRDANANGATLNDSRTSVVATAAALTNSPLPSAPVFTTPSEITDTPAVSLSGVAAPDGTVTVMTGTSGSATVEADAATGVFNVNVPLALGANTLSADVTTTAGATSPASTLAVFDLPFPVSGTSTADFSSADLSRALGMGATLQFISGTEAIVLTDGVLSVGADTNEAMVQRLYAGLLGRTDTDAAAAGYWDQIAGAGNAPSGIAAAFLGSPEYQALHPGGLSDSDFVASLYQNALGRTVETSYWTDLLASGVSRAAVAVGIVDSSEAKVNLASATAEVFAQDPAGTLAHEVYEAGLGREVDLPAIGAIKTALASMTPAQVVQGIVGSAEFMALHGGQSNADYVTSLYRDGLGRTPEAAGAAFWGGLLSSGAASRADVLLGIATSPEATARLTANL